MPHKTPRVIALHGAVGAPDDWLALQNDLGLGDDNLLAWDLACGAGAGQAGLTSWTREFLSAARSLAAGGRPLVLLGYSLGARLALHALAADGSLFSSAVLVAPHPGLSRTRDRASRLAEDERWAQRARQADWNQFLEEWDSREVFRSGRPVSQWRPDLRRAWRRARKDMEGRRAEVAASIETWSLGHQRPLLPVLARRASATPILWVTGGLDIKFTAFAREACAVLRGSRQAVVAGAGHRVPWEEPQAFARLVARWIKR